MGGEVHISQPQVSELIECGEELIFDDELEQNIKCDICHTCAGMNKIVCDYFYSSDNVTYMYIHVIIVEVREAFLLQSNANRKKIERILSEHSKKLSENDIVMKELKSIMIKPSIAKKVMQEGDKVISATMSPKRSYAEISRDESDCLIG